MDTSYNFFKLSPSLLHPYFFTSEFCYIDAKEYELDKILNNSDIGYVKFSKYEGEHPDYPKFKICFVKCLKAREWEMSQCLRKLDWVLTIKYGDKYTTMKNNTLAKIINGTINLND